ncbi:MAG TPA: DUF6093 family protein [Ilumatobacteraceae bacterium]|nr:DUF6093 family protein [Ilumatobacteraceae bacterium]
MSLEGMIAAARSRVADTFLDTARFARPSDGPRAWDPATQRSTPPPATTVHVGACRAKKPSSEQNLELFGDVEVTVPRLIITLPWEAPEIRVGDVTTFLQSADRELLRWSFRIVAVAPTSTLMYRRLGAEQLVRTGV